MPGFNHYPSSGCGWCVNHGQTGIVAWDGPRAEAQVTLRQYGADRSRAACFIDHNARCPVCNARVFYYQNRHGSRVFFDDLAPSWTKHPCTDNRAPAAASRLAFRSRGALAKISAALGAAGAPTRDDWLFGIVEAIVPDTVQVTMRVGLTQEQQPRSLTFRGGAVPIGEGDVVGLRNGEISFFDLEAMEARIATVGSQIHRGAAVRPRS
ncbi:hypothetical protein [Methylobacterium indicum]|uniref:hypothetical protein n=1 Tax=Methylobacterium indicum TaxID=1775910 RepID=UPI002435CF94|nr:hypothetical protein [Methylobacterium indicum]